MTPTELLNNREIKQKGSLIKSYLSAISRAEKIGSKTTSTNTKSRAHQNLFNVTASSNLKLRKQQQEIKNKLKLDNRPSLVKGSQISIIKRMTRSSSNLVEQKEQGTATCNMSFDASHSSRDSRQVTDSARQLSAESYIIRYPT